MLCRNCYKEIPDESKFCPECGATIGGDMSQSLSAGSFQSIASADQVGSSSVSTSSSGNAQQSGLSIAAMIFGILTCTSIIGFILGIIDLAKNNGDGRKHGGSIFAVIWGGIILAISLIFFIGSDSKPEKNQDSILSTQDTTNEEAVPAVESGEDVVTTVSDGIITTSDYTIKVVDYKVIPKGEQGNEYGDGAVLAIWYDTTNTSGKDVNPMMAWITIATAVQDNNPDLVNEIHVGMLPDNAFIDSQTATIKEGGTVSNAVSYNLTDETTPVEISFTDGMFGEKLGTITFELQ